MIAALALAAGLTVTRCDIKFRQVVNGGRAMAAYGATIRVHNATAVRRAVEVNVYGTTASGAVSAPFAMWVRPVAPHADGPPILNTRYNWLVEHVDDATPTHGFFCEIAGSRPDHDPNL